MKLIPTMLLAFATTAMTMLESCVGGHQLSVDNGLNKVKYHDQIARNGVRQMATIDKDDIEDAGKKIGDNGWHFHQSPNHPNNGYLYSRTVELSEKRALYFRYDMQNKQMDGFAFDPIADANAQASNLGVVENMQPQNYKDASIEPLFKEAQELAAKLGSTVVAYPSKGLGIR